MAGFLYLAATVYLVMCLSFFALVAAEVAGDLSSVATPPKDASAGNFRMWSIALLAAALIVARYA